MNIIGRIFKQRGNFYCIVGIYKIPILINSDNKLKNGDLVEICLPQNKKFPKVIYNSEIIVKKSFGRQQVPNISFFLPLHDRLKHRIIDLRNPENHFVFVIKSEVLKFFRNFFYKYKFIEINTPTILGNITEGGVKKFEINFYGKTAFLTMNRALYLRLLTCSDFKQIFEIGPCFVAGLHNTPYHVSEFLTLDWAIAIDVLDLKPHIQFLDSVFKNLLKHLQNFVKPLDLVSEGLKIRELNISASSPIITYQELIKMYLKNFPKEEKVITQRHLPLKVIKYGTKNLGNYFWVINFPLSFKQFYCATDENKKIVLSGELWWNNIKVASISLSDSDITKTKQRLRLLGLNENHFKTYLKAINYASTDAALGSINIERLLMVILNLKNIREVITFPRARRQTVLDP